MPEVLRAFNLACLCKAICPAGDFGRNSSSCLHTKVKGCPFWEQDAAQLERLGTLHSLASRALQCYPSDVARAAAWAFAQLEQGEVAVTACIHDIHHEAHPPNQLAAPVTDCTHTIEMAQEQRSVIEVEASECMPGMEQSKFSGVPHCSVATGCSKRPRHSDSHQSNSGLSSTQRCGHGPVELHRGSSTHTTSAATESPPENPQERSHSCDRAVVTSCGSPGRPTDIMSWLRASSKAHPQSCTVAQCEHVGSASIDEHTPSSPPWKQQRLEGLQRDATSASSKACCPLELGVLPDTRDSHMAILPPSHHGTRGARCLASPGDICQSASSTTGHALPENSLMPATAHRGGVSQHGHSASHLSSARAPDLQSASYSAPSVPSSSVQCMQSAPMPGSTECPLASVAAHSCSVSCSHVCGASASIVIPSASGSVAMPCNDSTQPLGEQVVPCQSQPLLAETHPSHVERPLAPAPATSATAASGGPVSVLRSCSGGEHHWQKYLALDFSLLRVPNA